LLGGFKIDDELELGWLLDGQVCRLRAFQDLIDKSGGLSDQKAFADSPKSDIPSR
jgi:hypothetical protein